MNSPYRNGVIHQQDVRDRTIAQQRIAESIQRESSRTDLLVDNMVSAVENGGRKLTTIERLWEAIQLDSNLQDIRLRADQNAADYPGFAPWLNGQRLNIETNARMRLAVELNEVVFKQRFANTVGFVPAYA